MEGPISFWGHKEQESNLILPEHEKKIYHHKYSETLWRIFCGPRFIKFGFLSSRTSWILGLKTYYFAIPYWNWHSISWNKFWINPLKPELNPICYLLALLAHHFLHVSRIRVKSLTFRRLMSYIYIYMCIYIYIYIYIYGAPILDVSRSHTTTQHSR